ncbi:MAG: hypothetical protein K0B16_09855 [Burkholderiaceae bacterium]|nr:hypothetical protein [Burkholderiaceae bacterium]
MSACDKPRLLFVPGHMCDERLYAAQVAALRTDFDCQVIVFRRKRWLGEIARAIFASQPERFHSSACRWAATLPSSCCASIRSVC